MIINSIRLFLLSSASAAILATPAFALDGQDLLNKINAAYKMQGIEFIAKKVIVDGDDVTLTEAGVIVSDFSQEPLLVGDIALEGVLEVNGGYTIDSVTLEDIDQKDGKTQFLASGISIEKLVVPAVANAASIDGMLLYKNASVSDIEFYEDGTRFLAIDTVSTSMTVDESLGKVDARFALEDFSINIAGMQDDAASVASLNKLQLELISGNITAGGSWNTKTGDLDIEEFKFEIDNVGTLSASFNITGYTMEFAEGLQEVAKEQAANSADPDAATMAGMSLLGLAENLGIKGAILRFDDASITKRVIEYMAAEQGVSGKDFTAMIKAIVPMYVAQLEIPALQSAITGAVNQYLDNPKSLSIAIRPKAVVTAPEILGYTLGDPAALVDVLGVEVKAND